MATINSVLGPLDTADIGFTLSHEHVITTSAGIQQMYPEFIDREGTIRRAINELTEAYNEGLIHQLDTGGLGLTWGNWESAMELIHQAVRGEGFGAKLAHGPKAMPEAVGAKRGIVKELRDKILDMKGGGAVMHDHRTAWSAFFCEMTAVYGASTQGRGTDTFRRPDLGYDEVTPGVAGNLYEALAKVEPVYRTQIMKLFWDTLGICMFGTMGVPGFGAPHEHERGPGDRLGGLRRGRRDIRDLGYGDALDFWRVLEAEPGRRLQLFAEMKLSGIATLTFDIASNADSDDIYLVQAAHFRPRGLLGILYWYAGHAFPWPCL